MDVKISCQKCDKPKIPGRGQRYCQEHRDGLEWVERLTRKACKKCGGPKGAGVGKIYCDDCEEAQRWLYERKRAYKKVRICTKCKKAKADYNRLYCTKCRESPTMCSRCGLNPTRRPRTKLCVECYAKSREANKRYRREWQRKKAKDPEWVEKQRELSRGYKNALTKAKKEEYAQTRRMNYRLRHNSKPLDPKVYLKGNGRKALDPLLPSAPLLRYIEGWLMENTYVANNILLKPEHKLIEAANVSEKLIREMRSGKRPCVRIRDADNLCYAMNTTIDWVYQNALTDGNRPSVEMSA